MYKRKANNEQYDVNQLGGGEG